MKKFELILSVSKMCEPGVSNYLVVLVNQKIRKITYIISMVKITPNLSLKKSSMAVVCRKMSTWKVAL